MKKMALVTILGLFTINLQAMMVKDLAADPNIPTTNHPINLIIPVNEKPSNIMTDDIQMNEPDSTSTVKPADQPKKEDWNVDAKKKTDDEADTLALATVYRAVKGLEALAIKAAKEDKKFSQEVKKLDKQLGEKYITNPQCPIASKFIKQHWFHPRLEKELKKIRLVERFALAKLSDNPARTGLLDQLLRVVPNLVGAILEQKHKQLEKWGTHKRIFKQLRLIGEDMPYIGSQYTYLTKLSNWACLQCIAAKKLQKEFGEKSEE